MDTLYKAKEMMAHYTTRDKFRASSAWYEISKHLLIELKKRNMIPQNASNAYLKAIELFSLVDTPKRYFDNGALPGDFIRVLLRKNPELDWKACSLVSGLEDRYDLWQDYPEKFCMNEDNTGNVLTESDKIIDFCQDWKANLYVSDIGFEFKDRQHEEEEYYPYLKSQIDLGMKLLSEGGTLIVKCFTMFNDETKEEFHKLEENFSSVTVFKPVTSKSANSECYWIAKKYKSPLDGKFPIDKYAKELASKQSIKILKNIKNYLTTESEKYTEDVNAWISKYKSFLEN